MEIRNERGQTLLKVLRDHLLITSHVTTYLMYSFFQRKYSVQEAFSKRSIQKFKSSSDYRTVRATLKLNLKNERTRLLMRGEMIKWSTPENRKNMFNL